MDSSRITLDQWRALQTVVDAGGFAQAAARLHRTQSAVSHAVARLQAQLGLQVLRIEGRKAVLTEAGVAVLGRARELLRGAADLEQFARNLERGWEAEIRLVADAALPSALLMEALRRFKPLSQGTRVQLRQVVMSGAEEALEEGGADLVIGTHLPPHCLGDLLLEVEFVAVAHPEHALHRLGRTLTQADLADQVQVVIRDSGARNPRDAGWLVTEDRWTVTSIDNAIAAVQAGLGFSWLPRLQIQALLDQGGLRPLPLEEGQRHRGSLYLLYGHPQQVGPATRLLAEQFRTLAAEFAP
ncbi:MAG: LysR family transcriptional regulator [Gammaproteobacteria bacterium]|nr:LysR family transcriptional regulator [Gammaproteobacteria bacterium]